MASTSPLVHAKHVIRAALLLIVFLVALVLGRAAFVPETWGDYGPYRASSVPELMAKPVVHGGRASCSDCHPDELEMVADGGHSTLACELCHAPVTTHAANDEKIADMPVHRSQDLCLLCHRELHARPEGFPQIDPAVHLRENDGEPGPEACFDCHEAHAPL